MYKRNVSYSGHFGGAVTSAVWSIFRIPKENQRIGKSKRERAAHIIIKLYFLICFGIFYTSNLEKSDVEWVGS